MFRMLTLPVHVLAGAVGLLTGFIALFVVKGGRLHRRSGMIFVYAMVVMGLLGSLIAAVQQTAPGANVPIGLLTAYLVVTALTAVRPTTSRWVEFGLLALAAAVTATLVTFGSIALSSPRGSLYGMPAAPFYIFAAIGALAAGGDLRVLRSGGVQALRGTPRLVRHLWRMSTALLIAAFSFFLGQAKVIPKPIRIYPLLAVPPLVVLVTLLYWLWRVRAKRSTRGAAIGAAAQEAA